MNATMYANLSSEANTLRELLDNIPLDNVIDRLGIESRLEEVEYELGCINPFHITKKARLTFRGGPVVGSQAISAIFASKATDFFANAVAAVSAGLTGALHFKGPIPDKNINNLMITGTAIGSFGFEFELPKPDNFDLCPEQSIVEKAVDDIRALFEVSATGSDDDLSDLVEEIHPRAISKIYDFLNYLNEQDAKCGLEFNNKFFRFSSKQQLESALSRLNNNNIHEEIVTYKGVFSGALPASRNFEFETEIDKELIKGKISKDISQPELIVKNWLLKPVKVKFTVITIGNSKPKFILKSLNDIQ